MEDHAGPSQRWRNTTDALHKSKAVHVMSTVSLPPSLPAAAGGGDSLHRVCGYMCLDSSGQSQAETFKLIFDEQPNSRVRASVWDFSPSSRGSVMKCLILSQFQTHHHHKSSLNIVKNNSLKVNVKLSTQLIVGTSVLRLSSSVHMRWRSVQSPVSCSSWFIGCHMYLLSCNVHASSWQRLKHLLKSVETVWFIWSLMASDDLQVNTKPYLSVCS